MCIILVLACININTQRRKIQLEMEFFMKSYNINRESPVPVYYQVAADLRNRINNGEWGSNGQLDSESELIEQYSVSRVTLRQALAELEKDDLIKRSRGKRSVVNDNPKQFIHQLRYSLVSGNYETDSEHPISAEMLELKKIDNPYKSVCETLKLKEGESAIYFKRLFQCDNRPIAIGRSWLPCKLVPDLEKDGLINNSLSQTMKERYHLNIVRVDDILETVRASLSDSQLLNSVYDTPLINIKGISYMDNGLPLESSNTLWLGDRVRFALSFTKSNDTFHMHST